MGDYPRDPRGTTRVTINANEYALEDSTTVQKMWRECTELIRVHGEILGHLLETPLTVQCGGTREQQELYHTLVIQPHWNPFVRNALRECLLYGYFAFYIEEVKVDPVRIEPVPVVVPGSYYTLIFDAKGGQWRPDMGGISARQPGHASRYSKVKPENTYVVIVTEPSRNGSLNSRAMIAFRTWSSRCSFIDYEHTSSEGGSVAMAIEVRQPTSDSDTWLHKPPDDDDQDDIRDHEGYHATPTTGAITDAAGARGSDGYLGNMIIKRKGIRPGAKIYPIPHPAQRTNLVGLIEWHDIKIYEAFGVPALAKAAVKASTKSQSHSVGQASDASDAHVQVKRVAREYADQIQVGINTACRLHGEIYTRHAKRAVATTEKDVKTKRTERDATAQRHDAIARQTGMSTMAKIVHRMMSGLGKEHGKMHIGAIPTDGTATASVVAPEQEDDSIVHKDTASARRTKELVSPHERVRRLREKYLILDKAIREMEMTIKSRVTPPILHIHFTETIPMNVTSFVLPHMTKEAQVRTLAALAHVSEGDIEVKRDLLEGLAAAAGPKPKTAPASKKK